MLLLAASFAALPVLPNAMWQAKPGEDPTWRVFAALATSVGLPYVLLSSTSPLLQSWYARAGLSSLPYRYYALSNAGSLVALLAYPVLIEPYLTGHEQAWIWSGAFVLFAFLCAATAIFSGFGRVSRQTASESAANTGASAKSSILRWLSLSACASALLLAVTNLLTQNIAPMPLLWVLPLSIYLLSFILCFESDRWYKRILFLPLALPALGCLAAAAGPLGNDLISLEIPLLSAALFVCCMACHGELARLRPAAGKLTGFYLSLSAGGALGGLFIALIAPHLFPANYEYPIAFIGCAVLLLVVLWREQQRSNRTRLVFQFWMAGLAGTVLLAGYVTEQTFRNLRSATLLARNFYGTLRVDDLTDYKNRIRQLSHGTITHGVQFLNPAMRHMPTTYYGRNSGVGLAWRVLERSGPLRMGVVGLGTGTLAAYGRAGDTLRFYEINPLVVEIARKQFAYLSDSAAHIDIVLGDARLALAHEASQNFDILVIDAFSGDAIPIHLLAREAFRIYWRHLKPDGVLVVHISNRYLNLGPVVMLSAREFGKPAWAVESDDDDPREIFGASYVLVSSRSDFFKQSLLKGRLSRIQVPANMRVWTDDYSNLWQVLERSSDR